MRRGRGKGESMGRKRDKEERRGRGEINLKEISTVGWGRCL